MLAAIKAKASLIGLGILVLVVIGVIGFMYYQSTQLELTKTKVEKVEEANKELKTGLETGKKEFDDFKAGAQVDNKTTETVIKETVIVDKKASEIEARVNKQVADIKQKFDAMEQTEENRVAKELEISTERVKGLWASFCIAQPEHVNCK